MEDIIWYVVLPAVMFACGMVLLWVLNSRQWLVAMVLLPLLAAGVVWLWVDGIAAIGVYWLTLLTFFAPFGYWLKEVAKMENADLKTLWQQPVKLWRRDQCDNPES